MQGLAAALLGVAAAPLLPEQASALPASKGQAADVGSYLPKAGVDDFVTFTATKDMTPAIRAGTIDVSKDPYHFSLPPTWKQGKVANIQSGNFCQPRCDEPWTEVVYEDAGEGKLTLMVAPLRRLGVNRPTPIDKVGSPESILSSIGPFITGTGLDEEDVVDKKTREVDGRTYYIFETYAPAGTNPPHAVTAVTAKGENAYLFIAAATDRQWSKSEKKLKKITETFRA
ncbi:g9817 [Coccomyxa viridis]|uniref:G9817 protein n=1 Tax=Coccomyxa viridis TaxID=1274662 RepID=A0ABP1G410_9CHLO